MVTFLTQIRPSQHRAEFVACRIVDLVSSKIAVHFAANVSEFSRSYRNIKFNNIMNVSLVFLLNYKNQLITLSVFFHC